MSEQKLQKFVRGDAASGQSRIQPRDVALIDVALIKDIASFHFLNTAQILALHPGSRRNLQQSSTLLYHAGYVERPPLAEGTFLAFRLPCLLARQERRVPRLS